MKCNIEVWSAFDGENSGCNGTIEVSGVIHKVDASGSASARSTEATVDGKIERWSGDGGEGTVERAITNVFDFAWKYAEDNGGAEGSWSARIVDGRVTEFIRTEEDEDDE
jgi:hypothetical protein